MVYLWAASTDAICFAECLGGSSGIVLEEAPSFALFSVDSGTNSTFLESHP